MNVNPFPLVILSHAARGLFLFGIPLLLTERLSDKVIEFVGKRSFIFHVSGRL